MKKLKTLLLILAILAAPVVVMGARTEGFWTQVGTYLKTDSAIGYDILINGSNHHINFGSLVGSSGYGLFDDGGTMKYKDNGGSWIAFNTLGGGGSQTPWTQNIAAAGYDVTNIGTATGTTATFVYFNGYLSGDVNGNASTSDALSANGANCSAGNSPLGVDASGAAEGCFDVWTEAENTAAAYISGNETITLSGDIIGSGATAITTTLATSSVSDNEIDYTTVTLNDLTFDVGSVSKTEFGYLNGVTSAIQTQLNAKADLAGETYSGTHDFSGATVKVEDSTGFAVASSSIFVTSGFASGDAITVSKDNDIAREVTKLRCKVDGGTSIVINVSDGTNDTETVTCGTTWTEDADITTNDTFTAEEEWEIQLGTVTGSVNFLYVELYYNKN